MQRELRRFLQALTCGDGDLADDIAQEAFMKAYLAVDRLTDDSRFCSWIFTIAHNTFLDYVKRKKIFTDTDQAATTAAEDQSDATFHYQDLYHALSQINPRERSVIMLFYLEGYQTREIAQMTKSSEESVRQALSRGRKHLRALLQPFEPIG